MTPPSKAVQSVQQLLADRERAGLEKYGCTVDRTDLQAGDWLQHLKEELADALLYVSRLQEAMKELESNASAMCANACVYPGGVIADPHGMPACPITKQIGAAMQPKAVTDVNLYTSPQSADDAERAAYLARWENAPAEATHLAEDFNGQGYWFFGAPLFHVDGVWVPARVGECRKAGDRILSSFRCEPRPKL